MPRTVPCLWFNGNAEEAVEFYCSVFADSHVIRVQRYPEGNPFPAPFEPGTAMTVEFTLDGQPYTALNGGPEFTFSEATSIQIMCADQDEIDHYWNALSADGEEGPCGWLKDKFGFSWQVIPTMLAELSTGDASKEKAVAEAIFSMTKLDVAQLREAYDNG
jgi:predicted 3-demethylubiquinone-9 3-methyltransferase (glyoxalase superfamily)